MFESDLIKAGLMVFLFAVSIVTAFLKGGSNREKKINAETDKRDFESMQDVSERIESIIDADRDEYAKRLHDSTR